MLVAPARDRSLLPDASLLGARFEDLDPARVDGTARAIVALRSWLRAASATRSDGTGAPESGVALVGDTGTGKTHLLTAAASALAGALGDGIASSGYRVILVGEAQLHEYLRRCWSSGDDASRLRRAIAGQNRSWLFLDDLGVAGSDERFAQEVGDLLLRRHATRFRALTVVSSNLKLSQIERVYGARVASRLFESLLVYTLAGEDQRRPPR